MGIRPENVGEREALPEAHPGRVVRGAVDVVERMGAESFLYATTGRSAIAARVGAACRRRVGESMEVVLDMDKAHFFGGPDGRSLLQGVAS